jgi:hypothetical protein
LLFFAAGPQAQPATRHHFLLVELQDGAVHCAADTWVQVAEQHAAHAADSSASSSSQPSSAQQQAMQAGASSCSSSVASQELLAVAQQASSSNLQVQLDWQPRTVQGFTVQLAEVSEVFRTLKGQSNGSSSGSDSRRMQYWDAFNAVWQEAPVPSRLVAASSEAVAVNAN